MKMSVSTDIQASPEAVWKIVSDIENAAATIRGITKVEVLEPATGPSLVGFKWRETRVMFGKEATEVMWVTAAQEPRFYDTRAESHGSIYEMRVAVEPAGGGSRLTMTFEGTPQTMGAKIMWALTGWMAKGSMRKALSGDLADIKGAAEAAAS